MIDFGSVTEVPGGRATREQLAMIQTRYAEAARRGAGARVLEIACGPGRGLGMIASRARLTVGGDYTFALVRRAVDHYRGRIPVLQFDAQALPFADASFDLIVMFEAIYYLPDVSAFLRDARRVLAPGGSLCLCSANREWPQFSPSPFAVRFYSAAELADLLRRHGFTAELHAAFRTAPAGFTERFVGVIRRIAVRLHLIPRTMAGKDWLKRVFYGRLEPLTPEIREGDAHTQPLVTIDPARPTTGFKVLYAFGQRT